MTLHTQKNTFRKKVVVVVEALFSVTDLTYGPTFPIPLINRYKNIINKKNYFPRDIDR